MSWRNNLQVKNPYAAELSSGRERFGMDRIAGRDILIGDLECMDAEGYCCEEKVCGVHERKIAKDYRERTKEEWEPYASICYTKGTEEHVAMISEKNQNGADREAKSPAKTSLVQMADAILKEIPLIRHDSCLYRYTGKSYKIIKDDEELLRIVRSHVSNDAFGCASINRFRDLLVFLKADDRLIPDKYEKRMLESQYYIAFQNGILDVRTLKLHKHSEKYLVFYELDAEWDGGTHCPPEFLKFLKQASGNDESVIARMTEAVGYLLSAVNEGKYFFVMGTASDSGKSTLAGILQKIVGDSYIAHISTYQLGSRFALGDIHGKTLNFSMDLPKGKLSPVVVSIIKQITGGDVITTDQKYEKMRETHSNMRFLFASNYPVTVPKEDDDDSFWNRMVIIPFQYSVQKCDMDYRLMERLLKEKDGIISFCLTALHQVLKQNCVFTECRVADEMKQEWRKQESQLTYTIQEFIHECIEVTGNWHDSVYAQDFYNAYKDYCQNHGWNCINYNQAMRWCIDNIPECKKQRIHRTGMNPMAGFTGMFLNINTGKEVYI